MNTVWKVDNGPALIEPKMFYDERGHFFESFNEKEFKEKIADVTFVQDNESKSEYGVVRGFHFQKPPYTQAKLVRVISGAVIDIIIDLRKDSPTFGKIWSAYLSEENHRQLWVPRGFAHGFISLKDNTVFQYKCDNFYNKESEGGIYFKSVNKVLWSEWMNEEDLKFSAKDLEHPNIQEFVEKENPF